MADDEANALALVGPYSAVIRGDLADAVVAHVGRAILLGDLAAGAPIPSERQLADELGLNRTTIRDGLARLEHLGLVDRRQGARARALDYRRTGTMELLPMLAACGLIDIFESISEVMSIVYESIAALAARQAKAADRRALQAATSALVAAADAAGDRPYDEATVAEVARLIREFHHAVARSTGSIALELLISGSYRAGDAIDPTGALERAAAEQIITLRATGAALAHETLTASIAAKDEAAARAAANRITELARGSRRAPRRTSAERG